MPENFNPTEWITTKEAAELTGYAPTHIRRLIRNGRIMGRKFGRDWMIDRKALLEYKKKMDDLGTEKHDPWRTGARQTRGRLWWCASSTSCAVKHLASCIFGMAISDNRILKLTEWALPPLEQCR